ncbi:biotin transporter BioY [Actinotalea sp. M2MS4P-6]|uniref:biotin transporter BioY n=1 Tax=Actinotalea sp. M2MS4P-6 TaxID=2983762 RepID=UPI0021E484A5|nr:biotin transporter BioY [Actinotalea sp. M2MS4P-6]MCV2393346.1 biotin transporter BioY [Actinotalea sp. M2MS4P-6]
MTDDAAPTPRALAATDLALIGTGAALVAVCSLLAIPVGPAGAPITLQTFAVLLVGAVLGARRGMLAVALYLLVGFAGLPIFAEGTGGLATFGKVTLGYLLAFPFAAAVTGLVVERAVRSRRSSAARDGRRPAWLRSSAPAFVGSLLGGLLGTLLIYLVGVPVLAARIGVSLAEGIAINAVFIPFDLVKLVLAAVVASAVHRAFPDLLRR